MDKTIQSKDRRCQTAIKKKKKKKTQDLTLCCLQETGFRAKDKNRLSI